MKFFSKQFNTKPLVIKFFGSKKKVFNYPLDINTKKKISLKKNKLSTLQTELDELQIEEIEMDVKNINDKINQNLHPDKQVFSVELPKKYDNLIDLLDSKLFKKNNTIKKSYNIPIVNQFASIHLGLKTLIDQNEVKNNPKICLVKTDEYITINIDTLENLSISSNVINELKSKYILVNPENKEVNLHIDGACKEKSRKGYIGVTCDIDNLNLFTIKGNIGGSNTNNICEYMALMYGLIICKVIDFEKVSINVFSDSNLLIKQLNQEFKLSTPHIAFLNFLLSDLLKGFKKTKLNHVLREFNKKADYLANQAVNLEEKTICLSF